MNIMMVSLYHVEYAVELAHAVSQRHNVHLVLSRPRVSQTVRNNLNKLLGEKARYTLLEKYTRKNPRLLYNFFIALKLQKNFRPDIIHIQECSDILNFAFILGHTPVVVTVHDVNPHLGSKVRHLGLFMFIRRSLYEKIIVHGERLKNELIKGIGRPPQDVFTIPHGCLFSFDSTCRNTTQEEEHSVLFFGRIEKYKGLRYLIEASPLVAEKIPDFKVIIAGTGDDLTEHRKLLEENHHFEVHDRFIPNDDVSHFFCRSSLIVTPYVEASQSGIIAMAFAFGKPVVTTDVGSLGEMVEDGKTGLVVPAQDPRKLANAIIFLLKNKDRRKQMSKEALNVAKTDLSWDHIARLTEKGYEEALKPTLHYRKNA